MGILYIVPTPIGNTQDITLRAIDILTKAEYIACEDTRHTGNLLKTLLNLQVNAVFISYYEENEARRIPEILNLLKNGKDVVLVSDAGVPTISDPGYKLVRECIHMGISVTALPGASSVLTALVASGLPTDKFLFLGYPPKKSGNRNTVLEGLKTMISTEDKIHPTVIFFEAPHRLITFLSELQDIFGDIEIVVCRELTKMHEEIIRDPISTVLKSFENRNPKGEFVILFNLYMQEKSPLVQSGRVE